jgi:hypothetical protein
MLSSVSVLKQSQDASNEIYYDYDVLFYSGQLVGYADHGIKKLDR